MRRCYKLDPDQYLFPDNWGKGHFRDVPIAKTVRQARDRHIEDLKRSKEDPDFPYYYDDEAASRAVKFIQEYCRHSKGKWAGKPFILSAWQEFDVIRPLFGWKRRSDNTRRFRKFFIFLPRKNGKSMLVSAIGLYGLIADKEAGAEVYCAATKEKQAKIVFREAKRMVKKSPALRRYTRTLAKVIECEDTEGEMTVLGRDSDTEDGLNVHFGLIDEYHAHKTDEMLEVLQTGTGAREQPLIGIITTAGLKHVCPCRDEFEYCKKILARTAYNEEYFVYITEPDNPENWQDPVEWYKANPQLGLSLKEDFFRSKVVEAEAKTASKIQFLVKHLNVWASGQGAWMNMEKWKACTLIKVNWDEFKGLRCFGGYDQGRTRDLTALALAFMKEKQKGIPPEVFVKMYYWMPKDQDLHERSREDEAQYLSWADQGLIRLTTGPVTRTDIIRNDINQLKELYDIGEIAIDDWSTTELVQHLVDDNFKIVKHRQTMQAMKFPLESLESLVISNRLRPGDNPVLTWNMGNAVAVQDGNGNIKLMKNESKNRIDGSIAAAMAIGRLLIAPDPVKPVYKRRGLVTL